ncbi:DUF899 family protein [Micromonospora sp. NPDC048999]|uniref:DUF899 family protein n=1 Tax=Micromonospora sp. NPDC048999 TaxID=3155391 RepID=UPI0033F7FDA4
MNKPRIVSAEEWQQERDELLKAEKEATRALDALAARRRRLPMVQFDNSYTFDTPDGPRSLLDLFQGHHQLLIYQFMDAGPGRLCPGCTGFTDNLPDRGVDILAGRGVGWVTVSDMPLAQLAAAKQEKGWNVPIASSRGTSFSADCGAGAGFLLSSFLRAEGDSIYRTYSTGQRGVDRLVWRNSILDITVYGRQEDWEDSPPGWPQHPTYG